MKSLRLLIMWFVLLGLGAVLSSASWAEDEAKEQENVKNMNDAAMALVKSNPALAQSLTKFAIEEATEVKGKEDEKESKEKDEATEKTEHERHIKILRDAASVLKQSNPELALNLMEMADKSEKKVMSEEKEEKKDK